MIKLKYETTQAKRNEMVQTHDNEYMSYAPAVGKINVSLISDLNVTFVDNSLEDLAKKEIKYQLEQELYGKIIELTREMILRLNDNKRLEYHHVYIDLLKSILENATLQHIEEK